MKPRSFFVGYLKAPADVRAFALAAAAALIAGAALLALAIGRTPFDVGASSYGDEVQLAGVLAMRPYPILMMPPDAAHPQGRAMMMGGEGKIGAHDLVGPLDGRSVRAKGAIVRRGDLEMLLVGGDEALAPEASAFAVPGPVPLGRWRIAGEVCDGKCASGGMSPGSGLAHKACANLCVSGGLPPILVAAAPVEGRLFLLLADAGGGPAPPVIADLLGVPVSLEGDVERRGDLLVFRVDWSRAARL